VEQDYSFDILRPLQKEARARGHTVRWFVTPGATHSILQDDEVRAATIAEAIEYGPDVVFVPGDRVPSFISGLKVGVFHGLDESKRGTPYPERGMFDLYCTEGPSRTADLEALARRRGYFRVRETGWLKLDTVLDAPADRKDHGRPQILYASTFTPRLSSAAALLSTVRSLSRRPEWQWLVTLHPLMAPGTVAAWQALESENVSYVPTEEAVEALHRADVMVSDNSSILQEFLLLKKPVVTYRNRDPKPHLIDIREPRHLESAIRRALSRPPELMAAIAAYGPSVTPWLDGASAGRVLDAAEETLSSGWKDRKPRNLVRNWKMRRQLG
jgi:CDP-glycerol glycerophosphotransferase (TagB/SpsB family)